MSKSTIIGATHRHTNLKKDKMTSAPKLKTQHKFQREAFVEKITRAQTGIWFAFFSLHLSLALYVLNLMHFYFYCTDYIYRRKKIHQDGSDGFKHYWRDLRKVKRYFARRNFGGRSVMA